ncbi:hypothetical protein FRC06_000592 [Ceratobasidium sp. 370]|nr:hypothetical protein FRC06_000592 [Ceratobasidium sp. 370]
MATGTQINQLHDSPLVNLLSGHATVTVAPVPESICQVLHDEFTKYECAINAIMHGPLPCFTKSGFPVVKGGKKYYKFIHLWFKECDIDKIATLLHPPSETPDGDDNETDNHNDKNNPSNENKGKWLT